MGRTIVPFNQLVRSIKEKDWGKFRRALRREDQERLDELFEMARHHAGPAAYASRPNPMEPILIGILIELLRRVEGLEERSPQPEGSGGDAQRVLDL